MYAKEMGSTDNLLLRMVWRWFHGQDLLFPGSPRASYGDEAPLELAVVIDLRPSRAVRYI